MLIFTEVPNCVSHLSFYSHTVAPQAVLSLKEIMCCSWRWVGAAPNPKDFGLFLAQEVRMIQPKMERNSRWREVEVFQVQHHLCLLEEGEYALCSFTTSVRAGKISNYLTSAHLHLCNHSNLLVLQWTLLPLLASLLFSQISNYVDTAAISYTPLVLK